MPNTGPSKGFLSKIFGSNKRTEDIELSNESGRRDKRLPKEKKKKPGIIENFQNMKKHLNPLDEAASIMNQGIKDSKKRKS